MPQEHESLLLSAQGTEAGDGVLPPTDLIEGFPKSQVAAMCVFIHRQGGLGSFDTLTDEQKMDVQRFALDRLTAQNLWKQEQSRQPKKEEKKMKAGEVVLRWATAGAYLAAAALGVAAAIHQDGVAHAQGGDSGADGQDNPVVSDSTADADDAYLGPTTVLTDTLPGPIVTPESFSVKHTDATFVSPGSSDPSGITVVTEPLTFANAPYPGGQVTVQPGAICFTDAEYGESASEYLDQHLPYADLHCVTADGVQVAGIDNRFTPSDGSVITPTVPVQMISDESTGITVLGENSLLFSHDNYRGLIGWSAGPDGMLNTTDDVVIKKKFAQFAGSTDVGPIDGEGVAVVDAVHGIVNIAGGDQRKLVQANLGTDGLGGAITDTLTLLIPDTSIVRQPDFEGGTECAGPLGQTTAMISNHLPTGETRYITELSSPNTVRRYIDLSGIEPKIESAGDLACQVLVDNDGNSHTIFTVADRGRKDTNPGDNPPLLDGRIFTISVDDQQHIDRVFLPLVER